MNQEHSRIVAIFGSSRPPADSSDYAEAYRTGQALAAAGWTVMNGGYAGTMEASARGARENGGRTIGVTCGEFDALPPNAYLDQTIRREDLFARIREMHARADAFIVLKGGVGTLAELALVWNLAKLCATPKPIVLIGAGWQNVLESWRMHLAVTDAELAYVRVVAGSEDAVEYLRHAWNGQAHPSPRAPSSRD